MCQCADEYLCKLSGNRLGLSFNPCHIAHSSFHHGAMASLSCVRSFTRWLWLCLCPEAGGTCDRGRVKKEMIHAIETLSLDSWTGPLPRRSTSASEGAKAPPQLV
eukprot:5110707-Amphidinium_carterae.1